MKLKPLGANIIIKPDPKPDNKTKSGIVLPDTVKKEQGELTYGTLEAVGIDAPEELKPGMRIAFNQFDFDKIKIDEVDLLVGDAEGVTGYL